MAKKQWVNLPSQDTDKLKRSTYVGGGVDSVDVMGQEIYIEVEFDKKDQGSLVTLEVDADSDNAVYDNTEASYQADTRAQAKISEDGKAKFKVKLSTAGGDRFKFKAKDAKSNEKKLDVKIETARKLYYQVIEMDTITGLTDFSFWKTEFDTDKRCITLEEIKSKGKLSHLEAASVTDSTQLFNLAKAQYAEDKDPYCFAVVWIDMLPFGPTRRPLKESKVSKKSKRVKIVVPDHGQLWLDIDPSSTAVSWKNSVRFEYLDKDNKPQKFEIPDADLTPKHRKVEIDTKSLPEGVEGEIVADVNLCTGFAGGGSYPSYNIIIIATRMKEDGKYHKFADEELRTIIVHEAGHKIGMVPEGTTLKKQSTFDEAHKKTGPHCSDTACVMWWTTESGTHAYCSICGQSVRRMPLYAPNLPGFTRFYT